MTERQRDINKTGGGTRQNSKYFHDYIRTHPHTHAPTHYWHLVFSRLTQIHQPQSVFYPRKKKNNKNKKRTNTTPTQTKQHTISLYTEKDTCPLIPPRINLQRPGHNIMVTHARFYSPLLYTGNSQAHTKHTSLSHLSSPPGT